MDYYWLNLVDSSLITFELPFLKVFPVSLEFYATDEGGYLIEPSRSHLELWKDQKMQKSLFKWAEFSRMGYFIKSSMFAEFRFCRKLNERRSCHPENTTITVSVSYNFMNVVFTMTGTLLVVYFLL